MSTDDLNILGLLLGFLAGWFLAYPVLWGYPKRNRLAYVEIQLQNAKRDLQHLEMMTDQLPATVYSASEKETVKQGYRQRAGPAIAELEKEKANLGEGHERLSFALSAIGMLLLTIGFAAQLWAALLPKPQPTRGEPQRVAMRRQLLAAFTEASETEPADVIRAAVCDVREKWAAEGVKAAIAVGHHDWRSLRSKAEVRFRDNLGLAQRRADRVRELLMDASLCAAMPLGEVTAVVGGPRGTNLDDDRVSEVFGIFLER